MIRWTRLLAGAVIFFALGGEFLRGGSGFPESDPTVDPTGTAGALKAQVETGGGYDPHSGNASRSITDLEMPGAVGVYGLDFVRHWNSTAPLNPEEQGLPAPFASGGWTHSWNWVVDESQSEIIEGTSGYGDSWVTRIVITFPDGHTSQWSVSRGQMGGHLGPPYSAAEADWADGGVLADHLVDMASDGSQFWVHLADGGALFVQNLANIGYRVMKVKDPHGLSTVLQYDGAGRLIYVLKQMGHYLQIGWGYLPGRADPVIRSVTGYTGVGSQMVQYDYSAYTPPQCWQTQSLAPWYALTLVNYGDPYPATYTYTPHCIGSPRFIAGPLLATADDPRYAGAMTRIRYVFKGGPGGLALCPYTYQEPAPATGHTNIDYFREVPFPVQKEISLATGLTVSELQMPCNGLTTTGQRYEIKGSGGRRTFYYGLSAGLEPGAYYTPGSNGTGYYTPPEADPTTRYWAGYQLTKKTDFALSPDSTTPSESQRYLLGYPERIFNGTGTLTIVAMIPSAPGVIEGSGRISEVRYTGANTGKKVYDWVNPTPGSAAQDFTRVRNRFHHWLFSQTDENNNKISYVRDSLCRVTATNYPDGSADGFTYTALNQVATHTLPSGAATETYEYDAGRGLLLRSWNSVDGYAGRKEYTYDSLDRVYTMTDGRARAEGAPYSVKLFYNARHQVTEVHYPPTPGSGPDPYTAYGYDAYGNCISIRNELGHTTTYTYDAYRRCTSQTEPLNAPDWNGGPSVATRQWKWIYDRWEDAGQFLHDASTHTSKQWRVQVEPAYDGSGNRRLTTHKFDYNDRIVEESTGCYETPSGSWQCGADTEVRRFTYDANGNKSTFSDSLGRVTSYTYDKRERLWKTTEPLNRVTETLYDWAGNKLSVKFPDARVQQWQNYDAFGQARRFIDERNNVTDLTYWWGPMKKLRTVITHRVRDDGGQENQQTTFTYDGMGKIIQLAFPDGSYEATTYPCKTDVTTRCDQPRTWTTRKGQVKTINYDARGREISHTWNDGQTPGITRTWDDANRLKKILNSVSTIDYTYDDAAQVKTELDTVAGAGGSAQLTYYRYPDGAMAHMVYPDGVWVRRDYTARGQLKRVYDNATGWEVPVEYNYLADGKLTYADYADNTRTDYGYDGRGILSSLRTYNRSSGQEIYRRNYYRDTRDRIYAIQRGSNNPANAMENGRGDHFWYDAEGQLTDGYYGAADPVNNPNSPQRLDHFAYDAMGNRTGQNSLASRGSMTFTRDDNGLNQYRAWMPFSVINYDDDIGGTWGSPGHANGVTMQEGNVTAGFNALNQPMQVTSAAVSPNWMFFGYDPLGRCVKRWTGALTADGNVPPIGSNPATYFYYDGWNLVQEGSSVTSPSRFYVHGARVDEIVKQITMPNKWERYFHYEGRGHCAFQTDVWGNIVEQYEYDAFGQPYFYNASGTNIGSSGWGNRFLFTGREYLTELKLYDYRNRMYQPELGRFMQPDPKHFAAGDYNLYRYCHNDPVNHTDPTGMDDDFGTIPIAILRLGIEAARQSLASSNESRDGLERAVLGLQSLSDASRFSLSGANVGVGIPFSAPQSTNLNRPELGLGWRPVIAGHNHPKVTPLSPADRDAGDHTRFPIVMTSDGETFSVYKPDVTAAGRVLNRNGVTETVTKEGIHVFQQKSGKLEKQR